jgi:large subunit ribosomal protein L30
LGKLAITWKRSTIGFPVDQRRTIEALGLRRLNDTVEHKDSPSVLGMVEKVQHLVTVDVISPSSSNPPPTSSKRKVKKDVK